MINERIFIYEKNFTDRHRRYDCFQIYSRRLFSTELLEYLPAARDFCTINTVQPFSLDSTNVRADHWLQLAQLIEKNMNSTMAL